MQYKNPKNSFVHSLVKLNQMWNLKIGNSEVEFTCRSKFYNSDSDELTLLGDNMIIKFSKYYVFVSMGNKDTNSFNKDYTLTPLEGN